jgi:hypothetical protein
MAWTGDVLRLVLHELNSRRVVGRSRTTWTRAIDRWRATQPWRGNYLNGRLYLLHDRDYPRPGAPGGRGCEVHALPAKPEPERPAERWVRSIKGAYRG